MTGPDHSNPSTSILREIPHDKLSCSYAQFVARKLTASTSDFAGGLGTIPNIAGAMATSPVLINSLVGIFGNVHGGSFTEPQIQAVLLTDAVVNACTWAVAFHTALALKAGLKSLDVQAIREGRSPEDGKLAALSALARKMIETRGRVADPDIDRFLAAGFTKEHALEVIAIVAASTITNYSGSITKTPLEAAFQEHAWVEPPSE